MSCPTPLFHGLQPPRAPLGDGATSCSDAPAAPLVDVEALSRGLPDGVYYAGRQLTPWMTAAEHSELNTLRFKRRERLSERGDAERRRELMARWHGQSVVLKWEIIDCRPTAPEPLRNRYTDGLGDEDARPFTWGSDKADAFTLGHCLIDEVIEDWHGRHSRSSNDYIDEVFPLVRTFGEHWMLPRRRIEEAIARRDLVTARKELDDAEERARAVGIDPAAALAEAR